MRGAVGAVEEALDSIGCRPEVVSLDPSTLDDVIACVGGRRRGDGDGERAEELMASLAPVSTRCGPR